jgi:hypothetical protein
MDATRIDRTGRIRRSSRMWIAVAIAAVLLAATLLMAVGRSSSPNKTRPAIRIVPTAALADGSRAALIHRETGMAVAQLARSEGSAKS